MKSLGLQIENQQVRYALVEHKAKKFRTLALDHCELKELTKIAKTAQRIILGLSLSTLKTQIVETKLCADSEKYYGYYPLDKNRWQEFSIKKTWLKILLETLKKQGLRVRAVDCQILAVMRLAKFQGLMHHQQQLWRLIEPNTVTIWQSNFSAIENSAVFYYNQHLSQIDALMNEYKESLNFKDELVIQANDPELNPLLGLALWNVI